MDSSTSHVAWVFTDTTNRLAVEVAERLPGETGTAAGPVLLALPLPVDGNASEAAIIEAAEEALSVAGWDVLLDDGADYIEVSGYDARGWQDEPSSLFATVECRTPLTTT